MNKKRPREKGGADGGNNEQEHNLCRPLLATGQCQFGDERCRFSHDLVGYLKRKEKVCGVCRVFGSSVKGITDTRERVSRAPSIHCCIGCAHITQTKRLQDLGESCPLFEAYGHCPSGITCRFGKGHIDFEKGELAGLVAGPWMLLNPIRVTHSAHEP